MLSQRPMRRSPMRSPQGQSAVSRCPPRYASERPCVGSTRGLDVGDAEYGPVVGEDIRQVPAEITRWVTAAHTSRVASYMLDQVRDPLPATPLATDDEAYRWEKCSAWTRSALVAVPITSSCGRTSWLHRPCSRAWSCATHRAPTTRWLAPALNPQRKLVDSRSGHLIGACQQTLAAALPRPAPEDGRVPVPGGAAGRTHAIAVH